MSFHFEKKDYLRKVNSFQVINKKPSKNETFYLFFVVFKMLPHEIFITNLRFGFSTPKNN